MPNKDQGLGISGKESSIDKESHRIFCRGKWEVLGYGRSGEVYECVLKEQIGGLVARPKIDERLNWNKAFLELGTYGLGSIS